jgi:hypothetical protein
LLETLGLETTLSERSVEAPAADALSQLPVAAIVPGTLICNGVKNYMLYLVGLRQLVNYCCVCSWPHAYVLGFGFRGVCNDGMLRAGKLRVWKQWAHFLRAWACSW